MQPIPTKKEVLLTYPWNGNLIVNQIMNLLGDTAISYEQGSIANLILEW